MPSAGGPATLVAPASWRAIDFISDLHLTVETPRAFALWADYLRETSADAVFILGDLFEAWVGDDARFEGFEARGAAVLADAAARRPIAFMAGNRDFLLGSAMLEACGVAALADPTLLCAFGERVLLSHGDAMCIDDVSYQQFRQVVRGATWRGDFLARPLAERRALGRALRAESERHKATQPAGSWFDVDSRTALDAMESAAAPALIHGHTHRPGSAQLSPGRWRHVLSDWELDSDGHPRAEVLRWQSDGFVRLTPAQAMARTA
ncbi:MAG TPA: UDP-2,3-diacylglucosamine diphosphatase [Caldimonas sp.]